MKVVNNSGKVVAEMFNTETERVKDSKLAKMMKNKDEKKKAKTNAKKSIMKNQLHSVGFVQGIRQIKVMNTT